MLHSNMASELDAIVGLPSVQRVMLVVKVLHQHSQTSTKIRQIVESSGLMEGLRQEAHYRNSGQSAPIAVLTQPKEKSAPQARMGSKNV